MQKQPQKYQVLLDPSGKSVSVGYWPQPGFTVLNEFDDMDSAKRAAASWAAVSYEITMLQRWFARLNPDAGLASVFDLYQVPPRDITPDATQEIYQAVVGIFEALVMAEPGTMPEKFQRMGGSPLLAHFCGVRSTPLTPRERAMFLQQEQTGHRTEDTGTVARVANDRRSKLVVEPATGRTWSSAADLARELGCHPVSLYAHLGARRTPATIYKRVFEYA
jgi:hypothetical protein